MKTARLVILAIFVGCSHRQFIEVEVLPSAHSMHWISIDCEYACIKDLVEKVAEHEGLDVRWEYKPDGGCPVRMWDVDPMDALAAVLDVYNATVVQTNNELVVRRKD